MSEPPGPAGTDPSKRVDLKDGTTNLQKTHGPGIRGVPPHRRHPIEVPPTYASFMAGILDYRPDKALVAEWHVVNPNRRETWWSIAAKYEIPVGRLIEFNFPGSLLPDGRANPRIVNWYLHYHEGFDCPETHDHINRKFEGGERIAIPLLVEMGKVVVWRGTGPQYPALDDPSFELPVDGKFSYEFKILPPASSAKKYIETRWVWYALKAAVEGELKDNHSREIVEKLSLKFGKNAKGKLTAQLKAGVEKKFTESWKITGSGSVDLEKVIDAVRENKSLRKTLLEACGVEGSFKFTGWKAHGWQVEPEVGVELSLTPFVFRMTVAYEGQLPIEELKGVDFKIGGKLALGLNFSPEVWRKILMRVGPQALRHWLTLSEAGEETISEIFTLSGTTAAAIEAAIIVGGAITASLICTAFMAWAVGREQEKGKRIRLSTSWVGGFKHAVFPETHRFQPNGIDTREECEDLEARGGKDAIATARDVLRKAGRPEADGSEESALAAFREMLVAASKGDAHLAAQRLVSSLEEKRKQIAQE